MKHSDVIATVRRYCREMGLHISPRAGNSPLIGKDDWLESFETWEEAHDFFRKARLDHIDDSKPYPWDKRKGNPIMAAKKPSAAQIAARARFAAAARAGTLKKGSKLKKASTARKTNPGNRSKASKIQRGMAAAPKRKANPSRGARAGRVVRARNPLPIVMIGATGTKPIAHFSTLAQAKAVAQAYADSTGRKVRIKKG